MHTINSYADNTTINDKWRGIRFSSPPLVAIRTRVGPGNLESLQDCGLSWFLERWKGGRMVSKILYIAGNNLTAILKNGNRVHTPVHTRSLGGGGKIGVDLGVDLIFLILHDVLVDLFEHGGC